MPSAREIQTLQALESANQCGAKWWTLWAYDRETDQLVLQSLGPTMVRSRENGKGFWSSLWGLLTGDKHVYLAFRSPRYVRGDGLFASLELVTGAGREAIQSSLPARVPIDDLCVVVSRSKGQKSLVVCESVGFYRAAWRDIVGYVDSPTTMHNVRLRMANAEENKALCQRLDISRHAVDRDHVIVESDEGTASILAYYLHLSWRDPWAPLWSLRAPDRLPNPRWSGGPPLAEV